MIESKEQKVVAIPVCLTPPIIQALDAEAAREGIYRGRSVIVRRACVEYLDRHASGWADANEASGREAV